MFAWMWGTADGAPAQFQDLGRVYSLALDHAHKRSAWVWHRITRITSTLIFVDFQGQLHSLNRVKLDRNRWVFSEDICFYSEMGMRRVTAEWASAREATAANLRRSHAEDESNILGLGPTYTREDVMSSFRRLACENHPDSGGDAQRFANLVDAKNRALARMCR